MGIDIKAKNKKGDNLLKIFTVHGNYIPDVDFFKQLIDTYKFTPEEINNRNSENESLLDNLKYRQKQFNENQNLSLIDFLEDFAQVADLKDFTGKTDLESVTEEINENIPNII
ncbi:MAG: hypothetical protein U1E31_01015 [Rickettsiales bacterium]